MNENIAPYVDEDGELHLCDKWTRALAQETPTQRQPIFPQELREFFHLFEICCVKDCCGIDAFDFSASVVDDLHEDTKIRVQTLLQEEGEEAEQSDVRWFMLWDLNAKLLKEEYLVLLSHLKSLVDDSS